MPEQQGYFEGLTPASAPPAVPPHKGKPAGEDSPKNREILFLALFPEASLFSALEVLQRRVFSHSTIATKRLHISLLGLGDYSDQKAEACSQVAALVRFPPIDVTLDKVMTFFHRGKDRHPFVLTSEKGAGRVGDLHQVLGQVFCGPAFRVRINPHMTLLWDSKVIPESKLDVPISWTAREFALVKSYQGQSRYDIVGRWPLLED